MNPATCGHTIHVPGFSSAMCLVQDVPRTSAVRLCLFLSLSVAVLAVGVFASVDEDAVASSLAPPARGRSGGGRTEGSKSTVPLVLTSGMLQSPSSAASAQHTITITVSYWSESCQPKSPMIQALDNPSEQVLARQATLAVCVTVLRHMCVASVLSTPSFSTDSTSSKGLSSTQQQQQLSSMDLTFQLARHGTEKAVKACVCARDTVASALQAANGSTAATAQAVCELLEAKSPVFLPAEAKSCSLHVSMPAFPAVKTFGKRLKTGSGFRMPPVNEQLQISSNHFAKSLVILWAIVKDSDGGTPPPLDASEDLVWGTHVLTKQVLPLSLHPALLCPVFRCQVIICAIKRRCIDAYADVFGVSEHQWEWLAENDGCSHCSHSRVPNEATGRQAKAEESHA